jgi:predicted  nucleic acid-binding Zn-ribbon protein
MAIPLLDRTPTTAPADELRFLYRPIVFVEPDRIVHPASWLDYTPFAFWIIDALRPSLFVELGCQSGNSYASFAQAVQSLGLPTACYGIDTWRGDAHAGFFPESVFEEWSAYHDRRFSAFSALIRSTFDDAREHFAPGSIDLLHLDGYHTFEASSHDFEMWRAKLSTRGVMLFHDINVRERDFGVWQLWECLKEEYPSFEFLHGHGLGVLGVGTDLPDALRWLLSLRSQGPESLVAVRRLFSRLGAAVVARHAVDQAQKALRSEVASHSEQLTQSSADVERLNRELEDAKAQLAEANAHTARANGELAEAHQRLAEADERLAKSHQQLAESNQRLDAATSDGERLSGELAAASAQSAASQETAARLRALLEDAEREIANRGAQAERLVASLRERQAELDRRGSQIERFATKTADLTERVGSLLHDLDARNADIVRLTRDRDRVPHALEARDAIISALDTEAAAALEQLQRARSDPRRRRRAEVPRISPYDGSRIQLSATSLVPPGPDRPTIMLVSHIGPWRPKAGNEYRVCRMLRWYRSKQYRVIPVFAPLKGEELPPEGLEAVAGEFGNAIQCHRDGRVEYLLRDAPDTLKLLDRTYTPSFASLLREEAAPAHPRQRRLLQIERTFCHDVLASTVLHLSRALGPHVLQVEYIWMTRVLPLIQGRVLKVVDTHDVFSSVADKVKAFGLSDLAIEAHEEAERLRRADLAIAIQDDERLALQHLAPTVPVVTAAVDFDVAGDVGASVPNQILYVASNNARNRKGLDDFLRLAWPRIHRLAPQAELRVVGSISDAVADREAPGLRVVGRVEDLHPHYEDAAVVINPAIAGTGLKIKILEALCHFRPVVTWPAGVEGLHRDVAAFCLVARDWYEFSEQVVSVIAGARGRLFTSDARALIARHVDAEEVYGPLEAQYRAFFQPYRPRAGRLRGRAGSPTVSHAIS